MERSKRVFEAFAVRLDEPWLEDPEKAWEWAMDAHRDMLHMSKEEIMDIRKLGQCIGQSSMEEQRRGFTDIAGRLTKRMEGAQKAKKTGDRPMDPVVLSDRGGGGGHRGIVKRNY